MAAISGRDESPGGWAFGMLQDFMAERIPAIFFGHGNPMHALLPNSYTQGDANGTIFRVTRK